ncbi:MAG TPA: 23S rRNA (pseudouridine(1915)-N(3))-methyltransferase RlmH [Clostridia bacterium]|nr:23S rRNA (pseudouridine(1915)-N(3))-methyltransferase RlmH [Clostridia bacterium]
MNFIIYLVNCKIDRFYREAIREYEKRLSRYCKTQVIAAKNAGVLASKLPGKLYKIIISTQGQLMSSEELAEKINRLGLAGNSTAAVIIGAEDMAGDESWAISPLEMDPGLQATVIFEQIYRAYRILHHEPYHK